MAGPGQRRVAASAVDGGRMSCCVDAGPPGVAVCIAIGCRGRRMTAVPRHDQALLADAYTARFAVRGWFRTPPAASMRRPWKRNRRGHRHRVPTCATRTMFMRKSHVTRWSDWTSNPGGVASNPGWVRLPYSSAMNSAVPSSWRRRQTPAREVDNEGGSAGPLVRPEPRGGPGRRRVQGAAAQLKT